MEQRLKGTGTRSFAKISREAHEALLREARQCLRRASRKNINARFTRIARYLPAAVATQIGLEIQGFAKQPQLTSSPAPTLDMTVRETMHATSFPRSLKP